MYQSIFKSFGRPIITPMLDDVSRSDMELFRQRAIEIERKLIEFRHSNDRLNFSVSSSSPHKHSLSRSETFVKKRVNSREGLNLNETFEFTSADQKTPINESFLSTKSLSTSCIQSDSSYLASCEQSTSDASTIYASGICNSNEQNVSLPNVSVQDEPHLELLTSVRCSTPSETDAVKNQREINTVRGPDLEAVADRLDVMSVETSVGKQYNSNEFDPSTIPLVKSNTKVKSEHEEIVETRYKCSESEWLLMADLEKTNDESRCHCVFTAPDAAATSFSAAEIPVPLSAAEFPSLTSSNSPTPPTVRDATIDESLNSFVRHEISCQNAPSLSVQGLRPSTVLSTATINESGSNSAVQSACNQSTTLVLDQTTERQKNFSENWPVNSTPSLLWIRKEQFTANQLRAFTKLTAIIKGHLTRQLFRSTYVRNIINTIVDSLQVALQLQNELQPASDLSRGDATLCDSVIAQLQIALRSFYDTFFHTSAARRMEIIRSSREASRPHGNGDLSRPQRPLRLSSATLALRCRRASIPQDTQNNNKGYQHRRERQCCAAKATLRRSAL